MRKRRAGELETCRGVFGGENRSLLAWRQPLARASGGLILPDVDTCFRGYRKLQIMSRKATEFLKRRSECAGIDPPPRPPV
jgi:hypothetical protein